MNGVALASTVEGVIERLQAVQRSLEPGDGVGAFNRMYLDVTERVASAIEEDTFADASFMVELDVRFANLWISAYDAVAAGRKPPSAWGPLFEERWTTGVLPIQHALAGMNAHIEHDLPLAVVETCRARRTSPAVAPIRRDYEAVNDILAAVESEVRRSFLTEVGRRADDEVGPVIHLVSAWNIDKARDLAWVNVETLWTIRGLESLYERYVAMVGHTVGMGSRILMTPIDLSVTA